LAKERAGCRIEAFSQGLKVFLPNVTLQPEKF
jgi:hypothetical protein